MAAIKTESQLVSEMRRFLASIRPDLDTSPNSIFSNLILVPAAIGGRLIFGELGKVQDLQVLSNLTGLDLEAEATNFGLTRKVGTRAKGSVVFFSTAAPTADLTIPAGTLVGSTVFNVNQTITYRTTASGILPGGVAAAGAFVQDRQRYETVPIPVEAVQPGLAGTVGPNRVITIQGTLTGVDGVYNPSAIVGGTDRETDDMFRSRVRRRLLGREKNLRRGVESSLLDNFVFSDAKVIRPTEDAAERTEGIDVWVIDSSNTERIQTFQHQENIDVYILDSSPLLEVLSVVGEDNGALTQDTHFWVERDIRTTASRFSKRAFDVIRLSTEGHTLLDEGENLVVNYTYADEIVRAQDFVEKPDERLLTADLLVKKGLRYGTTIKAGVTFFGGVDEDVEKAKIELALGAFFDSLGLGDPIQLSDLTVVIQTGVSNLRLQSVDQVIIREVTAVDEFGDTKVLSLDATTSSLDQQEIEFDETQYARLDTVEFSTIT